MLLALNWWRTEHAHRGPERVTGRLVREFAEAPTCEAEAWGAVLIGGTAYAAVFVPRDARAFATVLFGAYALGATVAPEPVAEPEPEPELPTRAAVAYAAVLVGAVGAGEVVQPRAAQASTLVMWYGTATADMVRPRWADGHGTWRVRGTAEATAVLPEPEPAPRRPWTTPLDRTELDVVGIIAMLYTEDR